MSYLAYSPGPRVADLRVRWKARLERVAGSGTDAVLWERGLPSFEPCDPRRGGKRTHCRLDGVPAGAQSKDELQHPVDGVLPDSHPRDGVGVLADTAEDPTRLTGLRPRVKLSVRARRLFEPAKVRLQGVDDAPMAFDLGAPATMSGVGSELVDIGQRGREGRE